MTEAPKHVHLVSDSTGETVNSVFRSAIVQFQDVAIQEHTWPLVRTKGQLERTIEGIRQQPGVVLHTLMDTELRRILTQECLEMKLPCVAVLRRVLRDMAGWFGVEPKGNVGRHLKMDEDYFNRIEAMDFALAHDDGQNTEELDEADIVLVGVSRTSKTPTSIYLSHRGLRAANIPYVKGIPLPETLFNLKDKLVVGLVIMPERLMQIRKSRLLSLNEERETSYVDIEAIKDEVLEARRLFTKQGWQVVDVTRKSIEETTAILVKFWEEHQEKLAG